MKVDPSADSPKKSLGQHWLRDIPTLELIADIADIKVSDNVLEIGPGEGSLTDVLLKRANSVTAVELDQALINKLSSRFKGQDKLKVIQEDIRKFNLTSLPVDYKVVANIPYYLTSYLVRLLSQTQNPPGTIVLLVQKEVALRLAAPPGKLSLLGVTAQVYWKIELGSVVPAELFTPPPKVESQIVKLSRRKSPIISPDSLGLLFQVLKIAFGQKRKKLVNSLSAPLHINKDELSRLLITSHIPVSARPQELSVEQWRNLVDNMQ